MLSLLRLLPVSWKTVVTVIRSDGRDAKGNPLPVVEIDVLDCAVGPRGSDDPVDRSDVSASTASLYRDPGFTFLSTDRIRVPAGARMAGEWSIDGRPDEWPLGWHVRLVRA